jgi:hypothetical protein
MANQIQTKITDFSFPSTFPQLKTDPALYDGTVMLHDYSHPSGIEESAGHDVHRLTYELNQYVALGDFGVRIEANEDFEMSLNFWANSLPSSRMALFGESYNTGSFLWLEKNEGTYGRLRLRLNAPYVDFTFDNEPIRANEFYNLRIVRVSNVITAYLNEQEYSGVGSDTDNAIDVIYIGANATDSSAGTGITQYHWDGYIWDFKLQVDTQVGTSTYTLNYTGTGSTPWVNLGTAGTSKNGTPYQGATSPVVANLVREVIGKTNRADNSTIVNLAATEAAELGVTDGGVNITPTQQPDYGLTEGRGFRLSNAFDNGDTKMQLNKDVSDALVAASTAGNNFGLSFWFKPELDVWDDTSIGYFFRWGISTATGSYNYWILLNGTSNQKRISLIPGGTHDYTTYENTNQGVVNVIFTANGAWFNGTQVATYGTPRTLQDFNSGNEFGNNFHIGTSQHSSDRNIVYLYRMNFADIDASGVTEAQWIAKEYETGVSYIKAITDSTT